MVLLEDLSWDVEADVIAVNQTSDETEVVWYELFGFIFDKDALRIKLET